MRKALAAAIFTHSCRTRFQRQFTKPSTATRTNEATDANNFTPANLEGTSLKTNLFMRTRTAGLQLFHHASRHRSHKRVIIKHRKFATFHDRAISQDRRTIGNTTYFIKSMRDKRNCDSRLGHCANCIPKLICFDPSKRTRRLVEKQHRWLRNKCASNFDKLPRARCQSACECGGIDDRFCTNRFQCLSRFAQLPCSINNSKRGNLTTKIDVVCNSLMLCDRGFLMDDTNSCSSCRTRRPWKIVRPAQLHRTSIQDFRSSHNPQQRAFSCAIFPKDCMYLPRSKIKIHFPQSMHSTEGLADASQSKDWRFHFENMFEEIFMSQLM